MFVIIHYSKIPHPSCA